MAALVLRIYSYCHHENFIRDKVLCKSVAILVLAHEPPPFSVKGGSWKISSAHPTSIEVSYKMSSGEGRDPDVRVRIITAHPTNHSLVGWLGFKNSNANL